MPEPQQHAICARMKPPATKLMSQRQYARSRGLSHQAVSKAVKSGRIPTEVAGNLDPVVADAAWKANTRPRARLKTEAKRPAPPPLPPMETTDPEDEHDLAASERPDATFTAARALREVYMAKRAKLEYERAEGKLVSIEEVDSLAFESARSIRDRLMSLPARLAPVLFAARDISECHRLLEEAMREICSGIGNGHAAMTSPSEENGELDFS